jgi:hypothetical protein
MRYTLVADNPDKMGQFFTLDAELVWAVEDHHKRWDVSSQELGVSLHVMRELGHWKPRSTFSRSPTMYHSSACPTCGSDDVTVLSRNPITFESAQQCRECGEEWFVDDEGATTVFDDADCIYEEAVYETCGDCGKDVDGWYCHEGCGAGLSEEQQRCLNGDNPDSLNGAY